MKITIKERDVEYISDYPVGWLFSAGDPFKVPVLIDNYRCFIKRFEKKTIEKIPGWPLLNALKGKHEADLPRIHDCVEAVEGGKAVHYVFYECLDGKTLEEAILYDEKIELTGLTTSLLSAMQSIHRAGFWFADFCEKNIFYVKGTPNRYLLIDLDSAEPETQLPNNEVYGSKDYWDPVYRFYKGILKIKDMRMGDISGSTLNYLQIIFLVLRLKIYYDNKGQKYKLEKYFDLLPALLNKWSPRAREFFLRALERRIPAGEFEMGIKAIILEDLLPCNAFIEGQVEQEISPAIPTPPQKPRLKDPPQTQIIDPLPTPPNPSKTDPPLPVPPIKKKIPWMALVAGVVILAAVAVWLRFGRSGAGVEPPLITNISISPTLFTKDSMVLISGKDLPPSGELSIFIGGINVPVVPVSEGNLLVKVPSGLEGNTKTVLLEILSGSRLLYKNTFPLQTVIAPRPAITVIDFSPNLRRSGEMKIIILGDNFHLARPGSIKAWLRRIDNNDSIRGRITEVEPDLFNIRFSNIHPLLTWEEKPIEVIPLEHTPETPGQQVRPAGYYYQEPLPREQDPAPYPRLCESIPGASEGDMPAHIPVITLALSVVIEGQLKFYKEINVCIM